MDPSTSETVALLSKLLWLPDRSRNMGIHLMAGKGSGKSRLMGLIAWLDFQRLDVRRRVPTVIFDPVGGTIDNFLAKLLRLPPPLQEKLWKRVIYVDTSGQSGYVIPMPLYYHLGNESLFAISQRYLDVVRRLDPNLQGASVLGWNPAWKIGTQVGITLAALGCQITEAEDMVLNPEAWLSRLRQMPTMPPEVSSAAKALEAFANLKEDIRQRRSESFLNKISLFTGLDSTMSAMFGASQAGINWQEVVDQRQIVLFDFRRETNIEQRRFKMVWAFDSLLSFIKYRGRGRHRPISVIIDELTAMFSPSVLATDLFAADLNELIQVVARNSMIWLTISHQELSQLSPTAQKILMGMGTQVLGVTSDPEAALLLARQFFRYDPYWVKKYEPIYSGSPIPTVIDYRTVEFTIEEQQLLHSHVFLDQRSFHFLARVATREGDTRGKLQPISISRFDPNNYPNEALVTKAREILMQKRGRRVSEVLSEIESRLLVPKRAQLLHPSATLEDGDKRAHGATSHNDHNPSIPILREKKAAKRT